MEGNKRVKYLKSNKGITLIALIVTVVILLILVGTGLKVLVDDKAVNRAEDAVGKANNRVGIEQGILNEAIDEWDELRKGPCVHEWEWVTIKEATCTETGTIRGTCTKCGEVRTLQLAALGHAYNEWTITKEATCTETGIGARTCTMCGTSQTYEIAKVAHTYGAWTILTQATCTETGTQTGACTKCGQKRTQTIPATGHIYEKVEGAGYRVTVDTEYSDGKDTAVIPAGFTVSGLATEQIIEDGLVIYLIPEGITIDWTDSAEVATAQQTYDQFVWIPMPQKNINDMYMCQSEDGTKSCRVTVKEIEGEEVAYCTTHKSTAMAGRLYFANSVFYSGGCGMQTYMGMINHNTVGQSLREPDIVTGYQGIECDADTENLTYLNNILGTNYSKAQNFKTHLQNEYNKIVKSVYENGGFYIGRYETTNITKTDGVAVRTVAGADSCHNDGVNWYYMYAQHIDYFNNNRLQVGSTMIQGAAYDQVMKFVDGATDGSGYIYDVTKYYQYRHQIGNSLTGMTPADKVKNIYDLEGNSGICTSEAVGKSDRATRGGYSLMTGAESLCASDLSGTPPDTNGMGAMSSILQLYITEEIGSYTQLHAGACKVCGKACEHNYVNGTCSMCGAKQ